MMFLQSAGFRLARMGMRALGLEHLTSLERP